MDDDLKELFKRAADISKSVPESLREAAFNRAVDALLTAKNLTKPETKVSPRRQGSRPLKQVEKAEEKSADYLLEHLDRTAYPQVNSAPRLLERALHLLRIAHDDFGIDGLGPTDIAKILTEKFRFKATKQAVHQSLDSARDYVDRVGGKGKALYRIMHAGEVYLDSGESRTAQSENPRTTRRRTRATTSQRRQQSGVTAEKKTTKKKSSSGRPGPRAALARLVDEGFFGSPRRIADIQQHLVHNKAHTYKTAELSPALIRLLRDGVLVRERGEDGQYEYRHK